MKQLIILLICWLSVDTSAQLSPSVSGQISEFDRILQFKTTDVQIIADSLHAIRNWDWKKFSKSEFLYMYQKALDLASTLQTAREQNIVIHFFDDGFTSRQDVGEMVLVREKSIAYAQNIGNNALLALSYKAIAFSFFHLTLFEDAVENMAKAIPIIDKIGNVDGIVEYHYGYGYMLSSYANIYQVDALHDKAIYHLKIAFDALIKNPELQKPMSFEERAIVYSFALARRKKYEKAIEVANAGLYFYEQNYNHDTPDFYNYSMRFSQHLADYYRQINNKDSTFYYLELGRRVYAKAYNYELQLYNKKMLKDSLYRPHLSAYHIRWKGELIPEQHFIPWVSAYDYFGDISTAVKMLDFALSTNNLLLTPPNILYQLRTLGTTVYAHAGMYKQVAECYKFISKYQDSTNLLQDNQNYATEKARTKVLIDIAHENNQRELDRQKFVRNGFIAGFGVMLLFAVVFFFQRNRISNEKAKSENLLLNILPAEVAEELKNKGSADAKHFDNVTVLFTDFKSFTTVSEQLSPQELVDELHACFKSFDEICGKYNIEKIKTIGDAYLAVCGLPLADEKHAENVVNAALEIRKFMEKRHQNLGEKTFEVRIGINSGSVVAGIVGVKKFAYDIWGDTVNTAARMEQNSEAGKINISETTYALVKDIFKCEYRGEIDAKNKGKLKMYYVESH
ncbi:MAG: adenylate/guanylate cyclase domain-containing protein [Bacteroidetes bacterium]|nr:adenylate/guanylate cyclase domain-containing protein [Bacteroidota bacterium]